MSGLPSIAAAQAQAELVIDLGALADNWRLLASRIAPAECAAVVKADAYGIGIEQAVPALQGAGCRTFFVAHVSEGVRARAALAPGSDIRIFVLNGLGADPSLPRLYQQHALTPVLGSARDMETWNAVGRGACAIHVDTGMNRLGCALEELALVESLGLEAVLLMSHLVASEVSADSLNTHQMARFEAARACLPNVPASLANSSGIFLPQRPAYDLARPGYALYGGNPTPGQPNPMRPVVQLTAPILQLRRIAAGETVGYNAQWTARRSSLLATIGVGYADGLPRNLMATDLRQGGEALVAGRRCPFAGRISMDLIVLDVTDVPEPAVAVGTRVELLGREIGVDEMGERAGTIGYEILTNLGRRYHRIYRGP
jgi:alanine racemase